MSGFWRAQAGFLKVKISPFTAYYPESGGETDVAYGKIEEMILGSVNYYKNN